MPRMVKPGDVVEVPLNRGFGYVQMVLQHKGPPYYGQCIRVFSGCHEKRPANLVALVRSEEQFVAFLPLNILVSRGLMSVIGSEPIPKGKAKLPLFKCQGAMSTETWHTEVWWIWDGKRRETKVGATLTPEQQSYPTRGIINLPLLIERIETGYKSIDDWLESEVRRTTPGQIVFENDMPKWVPLDGTSSVEHRR